MAPRWPYFGADHPLETAAQRAPRATAARCQKWHFLSTNFTFLGCMFSRMQEYELEESIYSRATTSKNNIFHAKKFSLQSKSFHCGFVLPKKLNLALFFKNFSPLFFPKPIPSKFSEKVNIQLRLFQVISLRQSRGIRDTRPLPMSSCTFLDCCSWLNPDTFVFPKMGNTPIFGWFIMEKSLLKFMIFWIVPLMKLLRWFLNCCLSFCKHFWLPIPQKQRARQSLAIQTTCLLQSGGRGWTAFSPKTISRNLEPEKSPSWQTSPF